MTLTLNLPPDVEGMLNQEAQRQGMTPESLALESLRRLFTSELEAPPIRQKSPTLALFEAWAEEDRTATSEELVQEHKDADELLERLQENRLSLRQVDLSDEDE